jgi:beta-lactamase regulating signal transducer with metallopeptidase domain
VDRLFLSVLNMSLTGAFVIAAVCLARLPLRKAPKTVSYCLWAVAAFRLVFPFPLESVLSLIPFGAQPIPADIALRPVPRIDIGIPPVNNSVSALLPAAEPAASVTPLQIATFFGAYLWLFGAAAMLLYGVLSYLRLKRNLRGAADLGDAVFEAEGIPSPFVLGILKPRIYLPPGLYGRERAYILLHERTHIRRGDHLVKLGAYGILCLHWFNPLAWLAFALMGVDMEMSCDERVLRETGLSAKKDYSLSLLALQSRRLLGGSPLAFSEGGLKRRIQNVLKLRQPSRIAVTLGFALVALLSVGFAVNRANTTAETTPPPSEAPAEEAPEELRLEVGAVSPTGLTYVLRNGTDYTLAYGRPYFLSVFQDGEWVALDTPENAAFTTEGILVGPGSATRETVNWVWPYGELPPGRYQFAKTVSLRRESDETDHPLAAEFTLEAAAPTPTEAPAESPAPAESFQSMTVQPPADKGLQGFRADSGSTTLDYVARSLNNSLTPSDNRDYGDCWTYEISLSRADGEVSLTLLIDVRNERAYVLKDGEPFKADTSLARVIHSGCIPMNFDVSTLDTDTLLGYGVLSDGAFAEGVFYELGQRFRQNARAVFVEIENFSPAVRARLCESLVGEFTISEQPQTLAAVFASSLNAGVDLTGDEDAMQSWRAMFDFTRQPVQASEPRKVESYDTGYTFTLSGLGADGTAREVTVHIVLRNETPWYACDYTYHYPNARRAVEHYLALLAEGDASKLATWHLVDWGPNPPQDDIDRAAREIEYYSDYDLTAAQVGEPMYDDAEGCFFCTVRDGGGRTFPLRLNYMDGLIFPQYPPV